MVISFNQEGVYQTTELTTCLRDASTERERAEVMSIVHLPSFQGTGTPELIRVANKVRSYHLHKLHLPWDYSPSTLQWNNGKKERASLMICFPIFDARHLIWKGQSLPRNRAERVVRSAVCLQVLIFPANDQLSWTANINLSMAFMARTTCCLSIGSSFTPNSISRTRYRRSEEQVEWVSGKVLSSCSASCYFSRLRTRIHRCHLRWRTLH